MIHPDSFYQEGTEIICWQCDEIFILEDIEDKNLRKEAEERMMCRNCLRKDEIKNTKQRNF